MKSQSLWLIKKNKPKILSKDIYYKKNDKTVLVKTLYSGVSKGTETLVTSGKVHKSQFEIMKCPFQKIILNQRNPKEYFYKYPNNQN